jgi:HlyD family secretion protein
MTKSKKNIIRKIIIRLFILAVIAGAITIGILLTKPDDEITPYRTEVIKRGTIGDFITATGTINPQEVLTVGAQVSGQITGIFVKLNDEVKKGQLLAEVDPKIAETQLKQSRANLETAQNSFELTSRDLERTRELVEKDFVAKVELERAMQAYISGKNSLQSAHIAVERDETNLSYTKIVSPIDGTIIAQQASAGQTLASNFTTPNLFQIAKSLNQMIINVNIPESDISKIVQDMLVTFTVDAYPDKTFPGKITSISMNPLNQQGVVTYTVVVTVDNKDRLLLPGMTANINITMSEKKDVLRLPASALRFTPPRKPPSALAKLFGSKPVAPKAIKQEKGKRIIYLWKNEKLVVESIELGVTDDVYYEIASGDVKEGDVVVTGIQLVEQ